MLLAAWDGAVQSINDISRKFTDTYALVSLDGEPARVMLFDRFEESGNVFLTSSDGRGHIGNFTTVDVIKPLPEAGVYALDLGGVAVVRRLPYRQWSEGLCRHNTLININGEERVTRIGFHVAEHLFREQQNLGLEEGLALLDGVSCVRLNGTYWLKKDKTTKIKGLFRNMARVGSWACGDFYWAHKGKNLREELKDEMGFLCHT